MPGASTSQNSVTTDSPWSICSQNFPKDELIYFTQVFLIYIIVITCLINLSIGLEQNSMLWASLLSGALGYLLPSPTPHKRRNIPSSTNHVSILSDSPQ